MGLEENETTPDVEMAIDGLVDGMLEGKVTPEPPVKDVETEVVEPPVKEPTKPEPPATPEPAKESAAEAPPVSDRETIKWHGQEVEVSKDELRNLAASGYDYNKKMQDLHAEVAPLQGLKKMIDTDPAFAAHLATYFNKATEPDVSQAPPSFEDPIEQVKWETEQRVMGKVDGKIQEMNRHIEQLTHQLVLSKVMSQVQRDPDYAEVQGAIVTHVESLPPELRRTTFLQLDQDPNAYLQAFSHFKDLLTKAKAAAPAPEKKEKEPQPEVPKPVQRKERAPILESGGAVVTETSVSDRRSRLERQKTKALRSGDPIAIAEWLQAGGLIDNIL